MKRFVIILFLSFFVWNYIGFFAYFEIEKQAAQKVFKKKMKLSFPREELKIFHFTIEESSKLIWHKAHEFESKGVMFDIVYSDTINDGVCVYTCISDSQETKLFKELGKYVAQDLNSDSHKPLKNWKLLLDQPQLTHFHPNYEFKILLPLQLVFYYEYNDKLANGNSNGNFLPPIIS